MRMRTKVCYLGAITGASLATYIVMNYKESFMHVCHRLNQEIHAMKNQMMSNGKQATEEMNDLGTDVKKDVQDLAETLFKEIDGLDTTELKVKTRKALDKIKGHVVTLQTLMQ